MILTWIVASTAAYWIASLFLPTDLLREVFYMTSVAVMIVVAITWGKTALRNLWYNDTSGPGMLILAVFLMAVVVVESRLLALLNYYGGRPAWLWDSPVFGFVAFQITAVGILKLTAVAKVDPKLTVAYQRNLWIAGMIGAFISGALLQPFVIDLMR